MVFQTHFDVSAPVGRRTRSPLGPIRICLLMATQTTSICLRYPLPMGVFGSLGKRRLHITLPGIPPDYGSYYLTTLITRFCSSVATARFSAAFERLALSLITLLDLRLDLFLVEQQSCKMLARTLPSASSAVCVAILLMRSLIC